MVSRSFTIDDDEHIGLVLFSYLLFYQRLIEECSST